MSKMQKETSHINVDQVTKQFLGVSSSTNVIHIVVIVQVGGFKCRALLDTGTGSSYVSVALLDQIPIRCSNKEVMKIVMMKIVMKQQQERLNYQLFKLGAHW
jgi:hypothetical protein